MKSIRALVHAHRELATLLVAAALLLRILVPAGFMPTLDQGKLIVGVCNGANATMVIDIPGLEHQSTGGEVKQSCAFADLALPWLGAADPILIAALVLFILALGLSFQAQLPPSAHPRLRPPLRGPPSLS